MLYGWLIVAGWVVVECFSCGLLVALVGMASGGWLILVRFGLAAVLLFVAGVGFLLVGLGLCFRVVAWVS